MAQCLFAVYIVFICCNVYVMMSRWWTYCPSQNKI